MTSHPSGTAGDAGAGCAALRALQTGSVLVVPERGGQVRPFPWTESEHACCWTPDRTGSESRVTSIRCTNAGPGDEGRAIAK